MTRHIQASYLLDFTVRDLDDLSWGSPYMFSGCTRPETIDLKDNTHTFIHVMRRDFSHNIPSVFDIRWHDLNREYQSDLKHIDWVTMSNIRHDEKVATGLIYFHLLLLLPCCQSDWPHKWQRSRLLTWYWHSQRRPLRANKTAAIDPLRLHGWAGQGMESDINLALKLVWRSYHINTVMTILLQQ